MTTSVSDIHRMGADISLTSDGALDIQAKYKMPDEQWQQILSLAQKHKQEIVRTLKGATSGKNRRKHLTPELLRAWKTARPWILNHLQELQAKGWTRKQLFQAGRYSSPHGPWGPAWSPNWLRPGVEISIDSDGAVRWTWTEPGGRQVSQAAGPRL